MDGRHLTIRSPPSGKYDLEIVTEIYPQKNTSLEVNEILTCCRVCLFLVYIGSSFLLPPILSLGVPVGSRTYYEFDFL